MAANNVAELRRGASVTLNFMNAEIDAVARAVATLTGRNVVVDPHVKGSINLVSTNPVTGEAVQMFTSQLRTQGFAMVFANGFTRWCLKPKPSCSPTPYRRDACPPQAGRSSRRPSNSSTKAQPTWCRCCAR